MNRVAVDFLAAGGNRHPAAADWDLVTGILAYGAGDNVALWAPLDRRCRGLLRLLSGHTDVINVVKFVHLHQSRPILVTGSADKTLRFWINSDASDSSAYKLSHIVEEHQASINCVATLTHSDLLFSGSADATVKVWSLVESPSSLDVSLQQNIALKPRYFPLSISSALLNDCALATNGLRKNFILAVAGTWKGIQIYVCDDGNIKLAATLTGHEGWIRSLAFVHERSVDGDLLLASASQDKYVRLWRVHQGEELPAISSAAQDPALGAFGKSLSNKAHRITCAGKKYSATFEALLLGHEDWIYSAYWHKDPNTQAVRLLTASADNSLAIWRPDAASGIWTSAARIGEISAQKGSTTATGSSGGFWIGLWSPKGDAVVSLSRTGSWRLWKYACDNDIWDSQTAVTGHVKEVKSASWSPDGSYLLTTSSDQTTRLWGEWKRESITSWHEISRPQIHGYDLNTIDALSPTRFVSGADEKLLRVFDLPGTVGSLLSSISHVETTISSDLPEAADIPVLGLSNKAISKLENETNTANGESGESTTPPYRNPAQNLSHPPHEDHLSRHLLWPEIEKLYGHGYEISTLAASHDASLIATACRASSIDHAVIRLYETREWREIKPSLRAHSLTVTGIEFSGDDQYLLSVGRDRQFAVWKRQAKDFNQFEMVVSNAKAHSRMILDCSWAPILENSTSEGHVFATAGRDKAVKLWRLREDEAVCTKTIAANLPVTAVAFHRTFSSGIFLLAYGLENGIVVVATVTQQDLEVRTSITFERPSMLKDVPKHQGVAGDPPSKCVTSLAWRPMKRSAQETGSSGCQLAVASDDTSLRIYNVQIDMRS